MNETFQGLPDSSFPVLLCILSPAAASLARLHSLLLSGICLVSLSSHWWTLNRSFTQHKPILAQQNFFLPSWRPTLWDSSLSSCPLVWLPDSCILPWILLPILQLFLYSGQMLLCPLVCTLSMFQPAEFQWVQVWQHTLVINRGDGGVEFLYLWWLFLYYLLGMIWAAETASADSTTKTLR